MAAYLTGGIASSLWSCLVLSFTAYSIYCVSVAIYRLFLSPLARFPGPKLAAVTDWYEVYYDVFIKWGDGGKFTHHIADLHEQYGPIVRITPDELHIKDPEFFAELYGASTKARPIDKSLKFQYRFGMANASFSTPIAEQHGPRRAALNPFFSRQRILSLHGHVSDIFERVSDRLATEYVGTGNVLNFYDVWSTVTIDVVTTLAFARPTNCSAAADFNCVESHDGLTRDIADGHFNTHFGWVNDIMNQIPDSIVSKMAPIVTPILEFRANIRQQVQDILQGKNTKADGIVPPTIFHDILDSEDLPSSDKSLDRLTEEAMSVVAAGMETTSWALTVATCHLLDPDNVHMLSRLQSELRQAMPDPKQIPTYPELERLPYLSAVISESLRLSYGLIQRLTRVNRLHAWQYNAWTIPAGTIVSSDSYSMHSNAAIFPEPHLFLPERWLDNSHLSPSSNDNNSKALSHYLVSFGKGSRGCVGRELAMMELYIALAMVFRRFRLELFETTRQDMEFVLDMVAPRPSRSSKGVRATVEACLV